MLFNPTEKFTSGGSYPMLNSIYVRYVRDGGMVIIGWRAFLQPLSRWVLLRSPERSSGPILIYYDGYYPLANSSDVRFVRSCVYRGHYPMFNSRLGGGTACMET